MTSSNIVQFLPSLYPPVICYIAMENGPVIGDLPIKHGDFPYKSPFSYDFPMVFL